MMFRENKFLKTRGREILLVAAAFIVAGGMVNIGWQDFQANVLTAKKSAIFDGTVYPVKKVPNWVDLTSAEWKASYIDIPLDKFVDMPEYNPAQLSVPFSSLNFSKFSDKNIRNAQVTYSTPYMGNYKLDGQEYAGSHLAVDIKLPAGTPVYAIANAVVVKAVNQSSGFGYHVVLRHDEVPSLADATVKTTYYSGYAHLGSFVVAEGDQVNKGQLIGYSGNSGTATTPHLHFQIDNDQAPWHLYWPFTSKDAADAKVGFWDGVNVGLGKDKALATTIHPLLYVQKYRNFGGAGVETSTSIVSEQPEVKPVESKPAPEPSSEVTNAPVTPVSVTVQPAVVAKPEVKELASFALQHEDSFNVGVAGKLKVVALDKDGQVISNYKPEKELEVKVENGGASLAKTYLNADDFVDGKAEVLYTPTVSFGLRLGVTDGRIAAVSEVIKESFFKDLLKDDVNYKAVDFLKEHGVINGYSDGTFKQQNPVTRVEAVKLIYEGLNKALVNRGLLEFADTDSGAWYAKYVLAAQMDGVVKGYVGNKFKPASNVTRAEFLKMLMEAAGMNVGDFKPASRPFADVTTDSWYSGYIAMAKEKGLIDGGREKFKPNEFITRGEVAQIIYRMVVIKISAATVFDDVVTVSDDKAREFYLVK